MGREATERSGLRSNDESPESDAGIPPTPVTREARPPWFVLLAVIAASILVVVSYAWSIGEWPLLWIELLVGLASATVGGLLGFVFGLPRHTIDESQPKESDGGERSVRYQPSNNLEQVSDWLTKLLIGVGLVELKGIGAALETVGRTVTASLSRAPGGAEIVTQVVIVVFVVLGFLASFLWTRIDYGPLQALTDSDAVGRLKAALAHAESRGEKLKDVASALAAGKIPTDRQVRDEGAAPATPPPEPANASAESVTHKWFLTEQLPAAFRMWPTQVQEGVKNFLFAPRVWESNPGAEYFPDARPQAAGLRIEAELALDVGSALVCDVRVRSLTGERLTGPVTFLLHPTFSQRIVQVEPRDDRAETRISASGWFTVIAIANGGRTILSFDLRDLPDAPNWFKIS